MVDEIAPKDTILGILSSAIDIERFGIRYYSALSSAVENTDGRSLLEYLINAEEKHKRFLEDEFERQQNRGESALKPLPLDNLDEDGRLVIFSEPLDDVDPSDVDTKEALKYGINIEQRSIDFYKSALQLVNDLELKEIIQKLIEFEKEHLDLLQKNLLTYEESGNWYGYVATG